MPRAEIKLSQAEIKFLVTEQIKVATWQSLTGDKEEMKKQERFDRDLFMTKQVSLPGPPCETAATCSDDKNLANIFDP